MDIAKGFQIDEPHILVPWDITAAATESLFRAGALERGSGDGLILDSCKGLGGLDLTLAFSFDRASVLCGIALRSHKTAFKVRHSRNKVRHIPIQVLYDQLQAHLEAAFGAPLGSSPGEGGVEFLDHIWLFPGVRIEHRAGEHVGVSQAVITRRHEDHSDAPQRNQFDRNLTTTGRSNLNLRETLNLKTIFSAMEGDGSIEVLDGRGVHSETGATETRYRFVGTKAIYRLVEFESKRCSRWEPVLPEHIRGAVQ